MKKPFEKACTDLKLAVAEAVPKHIKRRLEREAPPWLVVASKIIITIGWSVVISCTVCAIGLAISEAIKQP